MRIYSSASDLDVLHQAAEAFPGEMFVANALRQDEFTIPSPTRAPSAALVATTAEWTMNLVAPSISKNSITTTVTVALGATFQPPKDDLGSLVECTEDGVLCNCHICILVDLSVTEHFINLCTANAKMLPLHRATLEISLASGKHIFS